MKKPKDFDKRQKQRKKYAVYYVGTGEGCYAKEYKKIYLGDTWAVSKEEAESNVRFRYRDEKHPNGGYSYDILGDRLDEGTVFFEYKAEEIK